MMRSRDESVRGRKRGGGWEVRGRGREGEEWEGVVGERKAYGPNKFLNS